MEKYEEYGYNIQDGKVIIPELETEIKKVAFEDCSNLASVSIPPSVTEIENWVFSDCPSLASFFVSKDNKVYDSREDCNAIIHTESNTLIYGCKNTIIPPSVTEIGEFAFSGCSGLASIPPPIGDGNWRNGFRALQKPQEYHHSRIGSSDWQMGFRGVWKSHRITDSPIGDKYWI